MSISDNNKMNIAIILCIALCISMLTLFSCSNKTGKVEIVSEESYFSEVSEENGYVYYYVNLTIKNDSDSEKSFKLIGDFSTERQIGIIELASLTAKTSDGSEVITLDKGEKIEGLSLVFTGKKAAGYDGYILKADRNLPKIQIIEQ